LPARWTGEEDDEKALGGGGDHVLLGQGTPGQVSPKRSLDFHWKKGETALIAEERGSTLGKYRFFSLVLIEQKFLPPGRGKFHWKGKGKGGYPLMGTYRQETVPAC